MIRTSLVGLLIGCAACSAGLSAPDMPIAGVQLNVARVNAPSDSINVAEFVNQSGGAVQVFGGGCAIQFERQLADGHWTSYSTNPTGLCLDDQPQTVKDQATVALPFNNPAAPGTYRLSYRVFYGPADSNGQLNSYADINSFAFIVH
jgi:hypothetical protein